MNNKIRLTVVALLPEGVNGERIHDYIDPVINGQEEIVTKTIFRTFTRILIGRGALPDNEKETEMEKLIRTVTQEVVQPILSSPAKILSSQSRFDEWHRDAVNRLITECPIKWKFGSRLTVGMAQKIINLHCKDFWALELIPERFSRHFHPVIDRVILNEFDHQVTWTKLDSYQEYIQLQSELRQKAQHLNMYPLEYECLIWNKNR